MIPIVKKIFAAVIVLIISMSMILVDRTFSDLGLFNVHGGLAFGMAIIYLLPIVAMLLLIAVPMAIWKLVRSSTPVKEHQWLIIFSAPILLIINFSLFFIDALK